MLQEFEEDLAQDFMEAFEEAQEEIRGTLITLENRPSDIEASQALFRCIHSIKGNLQMTGLNSLSDMVHKLEDVLDALRKSKMRFSPLLTDLILLNMDSLESLCVEIFAHKDVSEQLTTYQKAMNNLSSGKFDDETFINAIKIFDPTYQASISQIEEEKLNETSDFDKDIVLFINLAQTMENRVVCDPGKTHRICEMVLTMNQIAGHPIDEIQLKGAAFTHDIGMAFLPLSLLNKTGRYDEQERKQLFDHPNQAATLLKGLQSWNEASLMVAQHHERVDGKGYPANLKGTEICDGAKLLAIADTFDSMSHSRSDREHRRTVIRIVAEINANVGSQFDEHWVDIFNRYVRARYLKTE